MGFLMPKMKTPAPAPEPVMPVADDENIQRAKKASLIRQLGRSGRQSTILSEDTMGG